MDYDNVDPDALEQELREQGLDEEQIEQALQQVRYMQSLSEEERAAIKQQSNDTAMAQSLTPRYCDSRIIRLIDHVAAERDLNRRISDEGLEALDPEGIHVLHPMMIHRFAQGQPARAHMRCH